MKEGNGGLWKRRASGPHCVFRHKAHGLKKMLYNNECRTRGSGLTNLSGHTDKT